MAEIKSESVADFIPESVADFARNTQAMILHAKYGEHQPLNRRSETYAREGVDLYVSTLADHVGAGVAVLSPLTELIRRHVFAAERVHGDDTTMPVLAPGKTVTGRLWA